MQALLTNPSMQAVQQIIRVCGATKGMLLKNHLHINPMEHGLSEAVAKGATPIFNCLSNKSFLED